MTPRWQRAGNWIARSCGAWQVRNVAPRSARPFRVFWNRGTFWDKSTTFPNSYKSEASAMEAVDRKFPVK